MHANLDVESIHSLCASVAGTDFEITNRIKSIVQVAYEYLGASSIVVYSHNRITEELEIVAMPGVANPELMRGPTDKLVFAWRKPTVGAGIRGKAGESAEPAHEVWIETDQDYNEYISEVQKNRAENCGRTQQGNFRDRERQKHIARGDDPKGFLATAKVHLWKGAGHTNDPVGQMFFNFWKTGRQELFTPRLRSIIRFLANLVRELLIDKLYHENSPAAQWSPERLLKGINTAFDRDPQVERRTLDRELADVFCQAALGLTQNYSGHADFVLLIGAKIGRVFSGASDEPPRTLLIKNAPITNGCIQSKKYYVGNKVQEVNRSDFDAPVCKSAMVAPVVLGNEVRAVIRLTSPVEGCFLDTQARAIQTLEHFARYGILRLDERGQRSQMTTALDFYTRSIGALQSGEPADLMQAVLTALGAEWGTFWPIDRVDAEGMATVSGGILFKQNGQPPSTVSPADNKVGIRTDNGRVSGGFTQALLRCDKQCPKTFLALHIPGLAQNVGEAGDRDYEVQVFWGAGEPWPEPPLAMDKDACGSCERGNLLGQLKLNVNTSPEQHTRVAFVVRDGDVRKGVVWLKFPELREIAWWERRYIDGLSSSLGQFLRVGGLRLAVESFQHKIPDYADDAAAIVSQLATNARTLGDVQSVKELEKIETYILTMLWKTDEVNVLLPKSGAGKEGDTPGVPFGTRTVEQYVEWAISIATGFAPDRKPWVKQCSPESIARTQVSGVFYAAILNVLSNVVGHGWRDEPADSRRAFIWIRKTKAGLCTCVGNTGKTLQEDPSLTLPPIGTQSQQVGLLVVRALLRQLGGDIYWLPKSQILQSRFRAPEDLKTCDTFFEFTVPLKKERSNADGHSS